MNRVSGRNGLKKETKGSLRASFLLNKQIHPETSVKGLSPDDQKKDTGKRKNMPSEFAHKKFGALVYKKLPDDIKRIIAENKNEYLIALHGPDPYYFCLPSDHDRMVPVAQRHHQRAFAHMQKRAFSVIKNISDGPELSYYYGMICHFVLDTFCHPLVDKAIAETGLTHGKIEMEFERYLLDLNGKNALAYPSYAHLPIDKKTAVTAARFYEDSSAEDFYKCMVMMKSMLLMVTLI